VRTRCSFWTYVAEKKTSGKLFKPSITSLEQYLEDVKQELFARMKSSETLQKELLDYYELNKRNLAFEIIN